MRFVVPAQPEAVRPVDGWRARLKPKPGKRQIYARDHRQHWCDTNPYKPEPPRRSVGKQHGKEAEHERASRCRRGPTVPVHRRSHEGDGRISYIPGMMRTEKHDTE